MTEPQHQPCDILIVGDLNIDYLGGVARFPGPDEEVEFKTLESYLGGSGANAAVVAARLGLRVAFYSAVGEDASGQALAKMVEEAGISSQSVRRIAGQASGMVFGAIGPDGERRLFSYRGANLALTPSDIPSTALSGARRLHLNGPEFSLAYDLLHRTRLLGIPNSLDPGSILIHERPDEMNALLTATDILLVNHVEFAELGGPGSAEAQAARLHARGVRWVVVKSGAEGCTLYRPGEAPLRAPAYKIQAVDTTGAGDAFNAAFLYSLLRGEALPRVLNFANAVGALAAQAVGATSGVPAQIDAVEEFIRVTPLKAD